MKTEEDIGRLASPEATAEGRDGTTAVEIDLDLEEAWEHRAELTEICRRIVGDPAIAEDVVQETYLQAFRNRHKLERRDGIMPWLVTVAKRRSLNELRRHKYSTPVDEVPERRTDTSFDPSDAVAIGDELSRVKSVLATLTDRERDLLTRQVYEGATLAELAAGEDSTAASVRSVLSRARSKIREAISESGARLVAPFGAVAAWARDRIGTIQSKLVQAAPIAPAGHDRLTELLIGGAAGVAIVLSTTIPASPPSPDRGATVAAPATQSALPVSPNSVTALASRQLAGVVAALEAGSAESDTAGSESASPSGGTGSDSDANQSGLPDTSDGPLGDDPLGDGGSDPDLLPDSGDDLTSSDPAKDLGGDDGGDGIPTEAPPAPNGVPTDPLTSEPDALPPSEDDSAPLTEPLDSTIDEVNDSLS